VRIVGEVPLLTVFARSKFDDLTEFLDSLVFPGDHTLIHHSGDLLDFFRCLRERAANQIALQKIVKRILDNNLRMDPTARTWEALDFTRPEKRRR
jgi:hypothetical protein